ncbi:MAG: hypothetical protein [Wendovervirus sonii]|uniref:Tail fiber protein n=1 Tax=phage Lak_Megaphage_Sonny TaxID=3109229 RepID=A0ABZ0Z3K7_9CAUD|nr:MAG: hypothetical protein [phage Lak_Megaphage_Sonny]
MAVDIEKYTVKANWGTQFNPVAQFPVIANRIFKTKAEAIAYLSDNSDSKSAIPGLILRIIGDSPANNGAYLVIEDVRASETNNMGLLKFMTGDIDIRLEVVWAKKVGDHWEECDPTEEGAIRCLKLTHADQTSYIPFSEILILDEYAKIVNVDASLYALNTSINDKFQKVDASMLDAFIEINENHTRLDDLSTYIDDFENLVDRRFDEVNASMIEAFEEMNVSVNTALTDLNASVVNTIDSMNASINTAFADMNASINEALDNIDSSLHEIDDNIVNIYSDIAEINAEIDNIEDNIEKHDKHLTVLDGSVNELEKFVKKGAVTEVIGISENKYVDISTEKTEEGGIVTVTIDASVCDTYDETNFGIEALASVDYIEDRFKWIEN